MESGPGEGRGRCSSCRERSCCYFLPIPLLARELALISSALRISPELLVHAVPAGPGEAGFALEPGGAGHRLLAARHPRLRLEPGSPVVAAAGAGPDAAPDEAPDEAPDAAADARQPAPTGCAPEACTFLIRLDTGQHLCGLGGLRPSACRRFPVTVRGGWLSVYQDEGCVQRFGTDEFDLAQELAIDQQCRAVEDEHRRIVAEWNELVALLPPGERREPADFIDFLIGRTMLALRAEGQQEGGGDGC